MSVKKDRGILLTAAEVGIIYVAVDKIGIGAKVGGGEWSGIINAMTAGGLYYAYLQTDFSNSVASQVDKMIGKYGGDYKEVNKEKPEGAAKATAPPAPLPYQTQESNPGLTLVPVAALNPVAERVALPDDAWRRRRGLPLLNPR